MLDLGPPRRARRPSLTPMIDVVFLLLVFFMLAARFGIEGGVPLALGGGGAAYDGPPRVVDVAPEALALNGVPVAAADLPEALRALMAAPSDAIVLRPGGGADVQRVVEVMAALEAAGFTSLVLVD